MFIIRFIIIVVIIYYLFKIIGRYLLPFLLKKHIEKVYKEAEAYKNYENGYLRNDKKESKSKSKRQKDDFEGEYVDFEEIKD